MKFILVRHGETEWNTSGKFGGFADVPLNDIGVQQAARVGEALRNESIDAVYCSTLSRAVKTADAILKYHDLPVTYCKSIREMNFGKWEGLTYGEIHALYPVEAQNWVDDYTNEPCLEGESLNMFYDRIVKAFKTIKKEVNQHDTVLIVAHSGVIKGILTHELTKSVDGFWKFKIQNGSIAVLEFDQDFPILSKLNG